MRHTKITTVLALLAAGACGASSAAIAAAASTGGAAAPAAAAPSGRAAASPRIRPTSLATWFGPGFYGQQTACGQTLTPAVVGVANRTLPCGTLVAVSYGGRRIVVPVLDRGPYSHIGADWDLTAGAARALGVADTVRIHAKIVGRAPNTPRLGVPATPIAVPASGGVTGGAAAG